MWTLILFWYWTIQSLNIINFVFFLITLIIDIQCFFIYLFSQLTFHLFCFVLKILLGRCAHDVLVDGHVIVLDPTIWYFMHTIACRLLINPSCHFIIAFNLDLFMWIVILRFSKLSRLWVFSIFSCLWSPPGRLLHFLCWFIQHTYPLIWFFSPPMITRTSLNIPIDRTTRIKVLPSISLLLIPASWWHPSSNEFFLLMIISLLSKCIKLIHLIWVVCSIISVFITIWLFIYLTLKIANGCV